MKSKDCLNYSQPDSYRFAEDSLLLVELALSHIEEKVNKVLDLGAGCGVIGIEYVRKSNMLPKEIHFIEYQSEFKFHLEENLKHVPSGCEYHIHLKKVQDFCEGKFDLILSNPPYYDPAKGRHSENKIQNNCRFSTELSPRELVESLDRLLIDGGQAWILMGNKKEQNHNVSEFNHPALHSTLFKEGNWSVLRFVKLNK